MAAILATGGVAASAIFSGLFIYGTILWAMEKKREMEERFGMPHLPPEPVGRGFRRLGRRGREIPWTRSAIEERR
jgi:hypothetical protein